MLFQCPEWWRGVGKIRFPNPYLRIEIKALTIAVTQAQILNGAADGVANSKVGLVR